MVAKILGNDVMAYIFDYSKSDIAAIQAKYRIMAQYCRNVENKSDKFSMSQPVYKRYKLEMRELENQFPDIFKG